MTGTSRSSLEKPCGCSREHVAGSASPHESHPQASRRDIAEDATFASLVGAISELRLLWDSREPLEAHDLVAIQNSPSPLTAAPRCYLLPSLAELNEKDATATLDSLNALRELLAGDGAEAFDKELFYEALARTLDADSCAPTMAGGVAGVLFSDGRLVEAKLLEKLEAHLDSWTVDGEAIGAAFLHGLLNTCREVAWNNNRIAEP